METLKEKIARLKAAESRAREELAAAMKAVAAAIDEQDDCPHEFESPPAHYAHEGGTCKLCGINEIAAHQRRSTKQG